MVFSESIGYRILFIIYSNHFSSACFLHTPLPPQLKPFKVRLFTQCYHLSSANGMTDLVQPRSLQFQVIVLYKSDGGAMSHNFDDRLPTHPCSPHVAHGSASDAVVGLLGPPDDSTKVGEHIIEHVLAHLSDRLVHCLCFIMRVELLAHVPGLGEKEALTRS